MVIFYNLSDKKNKNDESEIQNIDSSEMKGNERLRKIVMLENNDEIKEINQNYDPENSFDGIFFLKF